MQHSNLPWAPSPRPTRPGRLLAGLAALVLAAAGAAAQEAEQPVRAARLAPGERIVLDGSLSHPAWQRAVPFSNFVEYAPVNGGAPPQRTQVQVLFDEHALYVGVIAFDTDPASIRELPVRHDGVIRTQDFVVVYVDPIGTKRSAQWFRVGAAGSKADGMQTAADDSEDFAPDFDWDAAVQRRADGWSAVLRLPFASLRFEGAGAAGAAANGGPRDWRFTVGRRLPREQFHLALSVPLPLGAPSFIHKMQPLTGVQLPEGATFLTLRPSVTVRRSEQRSSSAATTTKNDVEASLDLKWRPLAELVIDGTLNPDFSQVALDVPQLAGNSAFALSFTEKRPFFFESSDLWRSPTEALYTRSLTAPRGGLRGTWRSASWAGTAIAVRDRGGGFVLLPGAFNTGFAEQPGSDVLAARLRRDDGALHWGGIVASRRYDGDRGENHVIGPDLGWHISDEWRLNAQWLASRTSALPDAATGELVRAEARDGQRLFAQFVRQTPVAETRLTIDGSSAGFRHDTGFVAQAGTRQLKAFQNYGWQQLGPLNQFFVTLEGQDTRERGTGETVRRYLRPGIWLQGARNLEAWFELYPQALTRVASGGALLRERYLASGLSVSPNPWLTLINTDISYGNLADAAVSRVRRGARWNFSGKLRPMRPLELEPSLSHAWLEHEDGGEHAYREQVVQWLAVWHVDAQHSLRAILQRTTFDRRAEPSAPEQHARGHTESLTYAWRRSAGTVLYVGATRATSGAGFTSSAGSGSTSGRTTETFVKLQVDLEEVSSAWR